MKRCLKCRTENASDAEYCVHCGFSLFEDAPPAKDALKPPAMLELQVDLEPAAVRVRPGERAELIAHVAGGPAGGLRWVCAGSASRLATIGPSPEGALVQLQPGRDEQPQSLVLDVQCFQNGELVGRASGTVEILADDQATPAPAPKPAVRSTTSNRRKPLFAGVAALLIVVIVVVVLVSGGGGVTGHTTSGACLHTQPGPGHYAPNDSASCASGPQGVLPTGTPITVQCATGDWLELSSPQSGDYVYGPGEVTLSGTPPACNS